MAQRRQHSMPLCDSVTHWSKGIGEALLLLLLLLLQQLPLSLLVVLLLSLLLEE
jgi:hypothetical protein